MANEAGLLVETGSPINFTVSGGQAIEKGALLKLITPRTVVVPDAINNVAGGIAAVEKINGDGTTNLAVFREGVHKVTLSGSCSAGDALVISGADENMVIAQPDSHTISGANILGFAFEDGTTSGSVQMELKPMHVAFD